MNRILTLFICMMFTTTPVVAQEPGSIGIFGDAEGTHNYINDQASVVVNVYVIHVQSPGATAAQFMITWDSDMLMTFLSEVVTPPYLSIGTSSSGIAVVYGQCIASPNMILTVSFFGQGLSGECAEFRVVEDPSAPTPGIYETDCADPPNLLSSKGGLAYVNPGSSCSNKVENSSWGSIKSLYR
jgi:hypothetical protein